MAGHAEEHGGVKAGKAAAAAQVKKHVVLVQAQARDQFLHGKEGSFAVNQVILAYRNLSPVFFHDGVRSFQQVRKIEKELKFPPPPPGAIVSQFP